MPRNHSQGDDAAGVIHLSLPSFIIVAVPNQGTPRAQSRPRREVLRRELKFRRTQLCEETNRAAKRIAFLPGPLGERNPSVMISLNPLHEAELKKQKFVICR